MIPVVLTEVAADTPPRVRMNGCPSCGKPLVLDHCGVIEDGQPFLDVVRVRLAQRLHLRSCAG